MYNEKEISTEYVGEILSSKGVKPSFQRLSVLKYLIKEKNHPSVEVIYQTLQREIPTLSKTTIYNTLNLLVEKGIVTALTIKENEVLYDYIEESHAHFQCITCGKINDIYINSDILKTKELEGFKIIDAQINFKGICKHCHK